MCIGNSLAEITRNTLNDKTSKEKTARVLNFVIFIMSSYFVQAYLRFNFTERNFAVLMQ